MDGNAKGGLIQFWELLTVIPCTPKDFKHSYLMTFGSQIKYEVFLKVDETKSLS